MLFWPVDSNSQLLSKIEISNPGGLYGQANSQNFPYVSDYRNPLLAEAMKVMGLVNKFNRGIAKVKTELSNNGNPSPQFDINRITEFRVTMLPAIPPDSNGKMNGEINGKIKPGNGRTNGEMTSTGEINGKIKIRKEIAAVGTTNDEIVYQIIVDNPGIKRESILKGTEISLRTIDRILQRMKCSGRIEYRGSRKTGGWFVKT